LAAARRKVSPSEETAPAAAVVEAPPVTAEPAAESPPVATDKPAKAALSGDLPKTTAERIAWCRQHDAK
jgi:hypothetical protein